MVLLYHPRGESRSLPLSLLHLGSMLPEFDVRIVDGRLELTPESALGEMAEGAVCLGISVLTGKPIQDALRASRAAKRRNPGLPVVWGGWHPSLHPEQCLAAPEVDICVRGQGEHTFRETVLSLAGQADLDQIKGISYRLGGKTRTNAARPPVDVKSLPSVDFGLVDVERYFARNGVRRLDYCSSQGTPQNAAWELEGAGRPKLPTWSGRSAEEVVTELAELKGRYRLEQISFSDADFFADVDRAEAIARGLVEAGAAFLWCATGRAEVLSRLTTEQWALIRRSGCFRVDVGAGEGEAGVTRIEDTGSSMKAMVECAERLSAAGIGGRFSFVAGVPKEPASSLADTYRATKRLRRINGRFETPIHFYAPYPGTRLAERLSAEGFVAPEKLEQWDGVDLDHFVGPWIPEAVRKFVPRYNFYFRAAFEPVERGAGKKAARWLANRRVRFDFYRFDFERRLVEFSKRIRAGGWAPGQTPISWS